MTEYRAIFRGSVTEKTIEKSRFLTYTSRACGEEEARLFLRSVREEHPLATHVCFAFVADEIGNVLRFSDDGEPQGTAGMPILNVLKARELRQSVVAVVRYFGGVKLGAGGLTRAYSGCAAEGVAASDVRLFSECREQILTVSYADVNAALRFLEGTEIIRREFSEQARFVLAVKTKDEENFLARAEDFFNGNVKIERGKTEFYPFPEP